MAANRTGSNTEKLSQRRRLPHRQLLHRLLRFVRLRLRLQRLLPEIKIAMPIMRKAMPTPALHSVRRKARHKIVRRVRRVPATGKKATVPAGTMPTARLRGKTANITIPVLPVSAAIGRVRGKTGTLGATAPAVLMPIAPPRDRTAMAPAVPAALHRAPGKGVSITIVPAVSAKIVREASRGTVSAIRPDRVTQRGNRLLR